MRHVSGSVLAALGHIPAGQRPVLRATLGAWLDNGGSASKAASVLFCHPDTVRHRMRRLEQLTGRSLSDPRGIAELSLAFEIDRRDEPALTRPDPALTYQAGQPEPARNRATPRKLPEPPGRRPVTTARPARPPSASNPPAAATQHRVPRPQPPRWQCHLAAPPYSARARPRPGPQHDRPGERQAARQTLDHRKRRNELNNTRQIVQVKTSRPSLQRTADEEINRTRHCLSLP
jgi:hypothetical protein